MFRTLSIARAYIRTNMRPRFYQAVFILHWYLPSQN